MPEVQVIIQDPMGLHARPAGRLARLAAEFSCSTKITKQDISVSALSIMGVMMLAATQGSVLEISTEGADADLALQTIKEFLEKKDLMRDES